MKYCKNCLNWVKFLFWPLPWQPTSDIQLIDVFVVHVAMPTYAWSITKIHFLKSANILKYLWFLLQSILKGPYADHILIPQGSTGSSTFFDIK